MPNETEWTGGNGNWTDPTWTNGVPNSSTEAVIDGTSTSPVTVTFDSTSGAALSLDALFSTLAVTGGVLTLEAASTLDALTQSGGDLEFLGGGTIAGPVSQSGGTLDFLAGGTIDGRISLAGGTLEDYSGTLDLRGGGTLGGTLAGSGEIVTDHATTLSGLTIAGNLTFETGYGGVTQTGLVTVGEAGSTASVVNLGGWTIADAGADMEIASGSTFFNPVPDVFEDDAPGTITVSGGHFVNRGVVEVNSAGVTLVFSGGTFSNLDNVTAFGGDIIFGPGELGPEFANGTLTGSGIWESDGGAISLAGGPITALAGSVFVTMGPDPGSVLQGGNGTSYTPIWQSLTLIAQGAGLDLDSSFGATNALTVDGLLSLSDSTFADSAGLEIGSSGQLSGGPGTAAAPILNFGTILAYGGTGGLAQAERGTLDLTGSLRDHGVLNADTLGVIEISGATNVIAGDVTGPGELLFAGGSSTIEPAAHGDVQTVGISAGATLVLGRSVADLYTFRDAAAAGISTLDLGGHVARLSHSTFSGTAGGEALVKGGGTLENAGTMTLDGAALDGETELANNRGVNQTGSLMLGDAAGGTASVINGGGATYTMAGAVALGAASSSADTVTNAGLFEKTGAGTATIGAAFTNTGTIDVTSGTLEITAPFTNSGTIIGTETQTAGITYITAPSAALFNQYAAGTSATGGSAVLAEPPAAPAVAILALPRHGGGE